MNNLKKAEEKIRAEGKIHTGAKGGFKQAKDKVKEEITDTKLGEPRVDINFDDDAI